MANNERIDDIISQKAFDQLDALLMKLGAAQTEFGSFASKIAATNAELAKTQSIKDLNTVIKESEKSFQDLEKSEAKVLKVRNEATKAEKELIKTTREKLQVDAKAKSLVEEFAGSYETLIKFQVRLKLQMKELTKEQKALDKSYEQGEISQSKYLERTDEIAIALIEGRRAVVDLNLEIKRGLKESSSAADSYDSVSASLDRMRGLWKRLTEAEKENSEIGGVLLKGINELDAALKAEDKTLGITNRSVGSYKEAIDAALTETGLFATQIGILKQAQAGYSAVVRLATIATSSFSKVLISSGIGAVVVILGSIVAYLLTMQKGMYLVSRATAGLSGFLSVLIDGFATLGEQIFNNIIPLFKGLGNIWLGLLTLNFDKVKEGFNGVAEAVGNIEPIKLDELAASAVRAGIEAARLEGELQKINKAESLLGVTVAKNKTQIDRLRESLQDESKSYEEKLAASKKAFELENENEQARIDLLNKRLEITKKQNLNSKDDTNEAKQKERDLEIEIIELQGEASKRRRELASEQNTIRKQQQAEIEANNKAYEAAERKKLELAKKVSKAEFDLDASRIQRAIDRNKTVLSDEELAFEDRFSNLEQYLENSEKAIIQKRDFELENEDLLKSERIRITEESQAQILALRAEGVQMLQDIVKDEISTAEKFEAERTKAQIDGIKTREAEKLAQLNDNLNRGLLTQRQYEQKRLDIIDFYGKEALLTELESVQKIIDANKAKGLNVAEEERKLAEIKQQLSEQTTKKTLDDLQKIEEKEREIKQAQAELANELFNLGATLIEQRFKGKEDELKEEQVLNEERKEREIADIEASALGEEEKQLRITNAEKKAQLANEKIAEKQKQLKIKQAKFDKALAIANIVRSTAQAIIVQLAGAPFFPISGVLIPIIAAIGAAQIAQVAATKIPAFAKGTNYSPEGLAIVGEEGAELKINPDGSQEWTSDKASLEYLEKGTRIIPHKESLKLVESKRDTFDAMIAEQRRSTKSITKELRRSRGGGVKITRDGIVTMYKSGAKNANYFKKLL